ncbi:MAG: ATP-binding protein [Lachnospiraceae bacterium]|nr:ATP-binding protein [Lachnospiraceae bacterium]
MAKVICVMGESGSGKTTSMRNLDPATTYYIDCDKKGLSWKGWRNQYSSGKNYISTDYPQIVLKLMAWLDGKELDKDNNLVESKNKKGLQFKTLVVDTLNGIMVAEEMRNINKATYDKWRDLASYVYQVVDMGLRMRNDLIIIFTAHSESVSDDDGYKFSRIKTNGKKLNKIVLESKFTTVLFAKCENGKYLFETHANNSTAKTPFGAFEENEIDNDITAVIRALEEF